jgi:hypothetical protein
VSFLVEPSQVWLAERGSAPLTPSELMASLDAQGAFADLGTRRGLHLGLINRLSALGSIEKIDSAQYRAVGPTQAGPSPPAEDRSNLDTSPDGQLAMPLAPALEVLPAAIPLQPTPVPSSTSHGLSTRNTTRMMIR